MRIGLNAGEPIAEDGDLFGLSVSLAARIGNWGQPGQVLCSNVVRELLLGKGLQFAPLGNAELEGLLWGTKPSPPNDCNACETAPVEDPSNVVPQARSRPPARSQPVRPDAEHRRGSKGADRRCRRLTWPLVRVAVARSPNVDDRRLEHP